jgi:hypothetical protein
MRQYVTCPEDNPMMRWRQFCIHAVRRSQVLIKSVKTNSPLQSLRTRTTATWCHRTLQCTDLAFALTPRSYSMDEHRMNIDVIRLKTCMIQFKNKNIQGQREGTCLQTLIECVHSCAYNWTEKYHAAREAKYQLLGGGP